MAAAGLDEDGRHEILLGSPDGDPYTPAGRPEGARVLCKLPLGHRVGEPLLADPDRDNRAEILEGAEDGRLYCPRGGRAVGE